MHVCVNTRNFVKFVKAETELANDSIFSPPEFKKEKYKW